MSTFTLTNRQLAALQDIAEASNDWRKAMAAAASRIQEALEQPARWTNDFVVSDLQKASAATAKLEAVLPTLRLIAPDNETAGKLETMARSGALYHWFWHGDPDAEITL